MAALRGEAARGRYVDSGVFTPLMVMDMGAYQPYDGIAHSCHRHRDDHAVTDSTPRNSRPAPDRPVTGDHPELETDETQRTESIENDAGRSRLLIVGIVALVLIVFLILLVVI